VKIKCFITVTVHTIRSTNIPHVSLHDMFRSDEAIFRHIGILQSPVFTFCYSPHTGHCLHFGTALHVRPFNALFIVKCIAYGTSKILNYSQCANNGQCGESSRKWKTGDCKNPSVLENGPIRPKHVVKGNVWYICATNCVDGNCNKTLSHTQYEAKVQQFYEDKS
jgi:hypothetical protein